eukprot:TRINITY_DN1511_c1_g6_i1.p1 TRINITY_DN1511_c1_g6~~TRINITY_DN1511_c1_g6_i1.p1  ORF type:complete len:176 (-),score=6.93 TRINITY_DN1511_c1_g6_i1:65-592(-)
MVKKDLVFVNIYPLMVFVVLGLSIIAQVIILVVDDYDDMWLIATILLFNPIVPVLLFIPFLLKFFERMIGEFLFKRISQLILGISVAISAPTIILFIILCIVDLYIDLPWILFVYFLLFILYGLALLFTFFINVYFFNADVSESFVHNLVLNKMCNNNSMQLYSNIQTEEGGNLV